MDNRMLVNNFLIYRKNVRQNDQKTIELCKWHLQRLLSWAGNAPFENADKITLSFPAYLAQSSNEHTGKPLSPAYMNSVCLTIRSFFTWCKQEHEEYFKGISYIWIECLYPSKSNGINSKLKKGEYYLLEDIRKILAVESKTLLDERGKAAVAFLYLSGMRRSAFLTLPISCVDLINYKIYQLPDKGVETKFHKAAITSLLRIPDLLEVVKNWDYKVRSVFPDKQTWYAPIRPQRGKSGVFYIAAEKAGSNREKGFRDELKSLCDRAGIPYRSPHKFRNGHTVYGYKHAKDIKDVKAISQNLMHDSIAVTDAIYAKLNEDDLCNIFANLI